MTCPPNLKFKISELKERDGLALSVSVEPSALDLSENVRPKLKDPVALGAEFSIGGKEILLQADFSGHWTLACSRCLAEHKAKLEGKIEETFPATDGVIDLGDQLGQAILLEFPQRSLCRQDCKGLCDQCGINLNEKNCGCTRKPPSPFEVLKKLK